MRTPPSIEPEEIKSVGFDEIIDVRSPSEFAEDHLPQAINLPVLTDAERVTVGTIFKSSPFEARRLGAGLVSANIGRHLAEHLADKPKEYQPLVYCWRGGARSTSMSTVMHAIGWRVQLLKGGYRNFRRYVRAALQDHLSREPDIRIIAGLTGSGKTLLLKKLLEAGEQVIDLEGLAKHRGSALGEEPSQSQPSQKRFESLLLQQFERFDFSRPIFVESESSRVGKRQVPAELWSLMRAAPVVEIKTPLKARAAFLVKAYDHFVNDDELLRTKMELVRRLKPKAVFERWEEQLRRGAHTDFVESMLEDHYDPAYLKSRQNTYGEPQLELRMDEVSEPALGDVAREIAAFGKRPPPV